MRSLWHTVYIVFSLQFLVFSYIEWQVPGFVSSVFPIYTVLLVALVSGIVALMTSTGAPARSGNGQIIALVIGVASSILVFHAADSFGAFRLVMAMVAFVLPVLLLKSLSDVKE